MPVFEYKAVTKNGRVINDKIDIDGNEKDVKERLAAKGLRTISIKKKVFDFDDMINKVKPKQKNKKAAIQLNDAEIKGQDFRKNKMEQQKKKIEIKASKKLLQTQINVNLDFHFLDTVKFEDVVSFTQMLLLLKKANFTNMRALTTIYNNTQNMAMKRILEDIINGLEAGSYIYSTMEYYKKVFPTIYVSIIKVGELSGSLVNSLEQALKYLNDSKKISKDVRKALTGPLFQAGFLLIGGIVAIIFGIPVMQDMYESYGLTDQIPEATIMASNVINWCGAHWYILLGAIIGIATVFIMWKKTTAGRYMWDKFKINFPIFGPLVLRLQLQKFFVAVQINLKNNARLQDAIGLSKNVLSNTVVLAAVEAAEANLLVGDSWIEPFETMPKFPPMILEMLKIGMETDMNEMIDSILYSMEEEIRMTIAKITKALPEVANMFMGVILIGFVIIILKPIMEVYMGSFLFDAYGG